MLIHITLHINISLKYYEVDIMLNDGDFQTIKQIVSDELKEKDKTEEKERFDKIILNLPAILIGIGFVSAISLAYGMIEGDPLVFEIGLIFSIMSLYSFMMIEHAIFTKKIIEEVRKK